MTAARRAGIKVEGDTSKVKPKKSSTDIILEQIAALPTNKAVDKEIAERKQHLADIAEEQSRLHAAIAKRMKAQHSGSPPIAPSMESMLKDLEEITKKSTKLQAQADALKADKKSGSLLEREIIDRDVNKLESRIHGLLGKETLLNFKELVTEIDKVKKDPNKVSAFVADADTDAVVEPTQQRRMGR